MLWENELHDLLAKKNVRLEGPNTGDDTEEALSPVDEPLPEMTYISLSLRHPGVYYRMDLVTDEPQLRVGIPVNVGPNKLSLYLVRLSHKQLSSLFTAQLYVEGDDAFHEQRGTLDYHLLHGYCELMKRLFWQGNLETMIFPPEIAVEHLL